jgi:hypothetical protein
MHIGHELRSRGHDNASSRSADIKAAGPDAGRASLPAPAAIPAGEFGRSALQTRDIHQILQRATELCAEGLDAPFAKVMEYMPEEKRLLIRAGVGWHAGLEAQIVADSPQDRWSSSSKTKPWSGWPRSAWSRKLGSSIFNDPKNSAKA